MLISVVTGRLVVRPGLGVSTTARTENQPVERVFVIVVYGGILHLVCP
jgi:hypothetical protein